MTINPPSWALRTATLQDWARVKSAHHRRRMLIEWPNRKALRGWAKEQGWPTPRFGFEEAFITEMLSNDKNFALALNDSGMEIRIPIKNYTLSAEKLEELDELYDERSSFDQPVGWGLLVEELREIRRAVEVGVKVEIEGTQTVLVGWQGFYDWAHGRYHMLEDGYDSWIGDDDS